MPRKFFPWSSIGRQHHEHGLLAMYVFCVLAQQAREAVLCCLLFELFLWLPICWRCRVCSFSMYAPNVTGAGGKPVVTNSVLDLHINFLFVYIYIYIYIFFFYGSGFVSWLTDPDPTHLLSIANKNNLLKHHITNKIFHNKCWWWLKGGNIRTEDFVKNFYGSGSAGSPNVMDPEQR